jgi:hypothetical protein
MTDQTIAFEWRSQTKCDFTDQQNSHEKKEKLDQSCSHWQPPILRSDK